MAAGPAAHIDAAATPVYEPGAVVGAASFGDNAMDIRFIAAAAALPLAACMGSEAPVETAPPPPAEMTCNADAAQRYVGQTASPDVGAAILKATGARTLRWGPPHSAMTMDYREDRVNIMYDDAYKITQVTCG